MRIVSFDNLKTFYNNLKDILSEKKDIEKLTINTTNNSDNVYINSNEILSFNTAQTFTSKTFTLESPSDTTIENTYLYLYIIQMDRYSMLVHQYKNLVN